MNEGLKMGQLQEEHYNDWFNDHKIGLEIDFLDEHKDERILDDDIPDFLDNHSDDFEEFAKKRYSEESK